MPTVAVIGPYRFFFYSNERNEPAHIHVQRERNLAKFWLEPVMLAKSSGFAAHELRRVQAIIVDNRQRFLDSWNEHFNR